MLRGTSSRYLASAWLLSTLRRPVCLCDATTRARKDCDLSAFGTLTRTTPPPSAPRVLYIVVRATVAVAVCPQRATVTMRTGLTPRAQSPLVSQNKPAQYIPGPEDGGETSATLPVSVLL